MSLQAKFDLAALKVKKLAKEPNNEEKLELYAYFKQGNGFTWEKYVPPSSTAQTSSWTSIASTIKSAVSGDTMKEMIDMKKNEAWEKVKDVPVEEAQQRYIDLVEKLVETHGLKEKN